MGTVTGLTAERMLEIEAACIVAGGVVVNDLILTKHDGSTVNAGNVRGPQGPVGPGITWRSAWNPGTTYAVGDGVSYGGSSYRRSVAGTTATTPDADATNWGIMAAAGTGAVSVAQEAWHIVGAAGEPAFQNGNVWYGAFEKPAFRKTPDGVVKLRGVIKGTGTAGAIFTLPAGYRPSGIRIFSSRGTFGAGPVEQSARIDIATNGDVTPQSAIPASGFLSLELEFDIDPTTFPAGKSIVPVVTTLPLGPTTGDEIYFQTAAMKTDGLMWHLRYDLSAPGTYKWIVLGSASPLFAEDPTDRSLVTNRSLYQSLGGASNPTLVLPLAGDYMVDLGARAYMSIGNSVWLSYDIGATAALDADAAWGVYNGAASPSVDNISRPRRKNGLAAVTLTMKARANTDSDSAFSNRWFSATPIRLG